MIPTMTKTPTEFILPNWNAPDSIRALSTTRLGGHSAGPYQGFNLATHVGDSPEAVKSNRVILCETLELSPEPCWLNQTHSTEVAILDSVENYKVDADAAISRVAGMIAVVMTADCLPILICNAQGDEVAAVHAGWRGLVDGIIPETLKKMQSNNDQLMAWIGPAISQSCFEIGDEVRDLFLNRFIDAQRRFEQNRPGHWLCDLPGLAVDQLNALGVHQVHCSDLCSFGDVRRFYSYRREKRCGRMASLIWIKSDA